MTTGSSFARLVELAREPSSEKRRELLREVTDLFFASAASRSAREDALFGEVLQAVASEMQDGVLAELSQRFADAPDAPVGLMRDLANRSFEVAEPVLKHSPVLSDKDLLEVINDRSQEHIRAVAQRKSVSELLSDAIVRVGDDKTLETLLQNEGARFTRTGMEQVVDRARANAQLHESVVGRADIPLDLLNEMLFLVEQRLRFQILERNAAVDPQTLDEALAKTRQRLQRASMTSREDTKAAEADIRKQRAAGELDARVLIAYYRDRKLNHFMCGLAEMTGVDYDTAAGIIARQDIDALATICRAADIERPLFVTIAVLTCGGDRAMSKAEEFGKLYLSVPVEAAQRAMRFFQVRKASSQVAA